MTSQGVEPWVSLSYGNPIYPGGGDADFGSDIPSGATALAAWDNYVSAFVNRYAEHTDEWEIWNEPDHGGNRIPVGDYASFVIRTAQTLRAAQPDARILVGAVTYGGMDDYILDVLSSIKASGHINLVNAVTYHPYSANPDSSHGAVATMRQAISNIAPHVTIQQGETGAPSEYQTRFALARRNWTETSQAKWALRRMLGDLGRDIPTSLFGLMEMDYIGEDNTKGLLALPGDRFDDRPDAQKTVAHVKRGYHAVQHVTAIFDDQLTRHTGLTYTDNTSASLSVFAYEHDNGGQVVTIWEDGDTPDDQELGDTPRWVGFVFQDLLFTDPVLVDLLSGEIFALPQSSWWTEAGATHFASIPVYDSPVAILDRQVLPEPASGLLLAAGGAVELRRRRRGRLSRRDF